MDIMNKSILAALIGLIVCSCIETRKEVRTFYQLIGKSNERLTKNGFSLLHYGWKCDPTIQKISMRYTTEKYKFKTVEEVRCFIVPLFEEYIKPFNEDKSIRPYLLTYPLGARNFEFNIIFQEKVAHNVVAPWIDAVY